MVILMAGGRAESLRERKGRLREARLTPAGEDATSSLTELILSSTSGLEVSFFDAGYLLASGTGPTAFRKYPRFPALSVRGRQA